ncbi:MAG: cytochrome c [Bryobacteraceae bacterium]
MKRAALLLLPVLACAQDIVTRGLDVYNKTCASAYCHVAKGASGGSAPRLAARGFDEAYMSQVVRRGIPGSAMPGFATSLSAPELAAVIAYVGSLNGIAPAPTRAAESAPEKQLPPDAERGRELFFDSVRGFGRCATCHEVTDRGVPVAGSIGKVPATARDLRTLATPQIHTATVDGESFPALIVSHGNAQTKLYDLTSPPPVLRTFATATAKVTDGSPWRHSDVLKSYSDPDLELILAFLRAVATP